MIPNDSNFFPGLFLGNGFFSECERPCWGMFPGNILSNQFDARIPTQIMMKAYTFVGFFYLLPQLQDGTGRFDYIWENYGQAADNLEKKAAG